MPTYDVEIEAKVKKVVRVDAPSMREAEEAAHQAFSVVEDGTDEWYSQETLNITEVKDAEES